MKTIELEIDEQTLAAVQLLAKSTNRSVEELISQFLRDLASPPPPIGIFRDDADLIDEITEEAMIAREKSWLRNSHE